MKPRPDDQRHRNKGEVMSTSIIRSRLLRIAIGCALTGFVTAGCGVDKSVARSPAGGGGVPVMPMPMPGSATLSGRVLDSSGQGVAGAIVKVAETDATTMTDATGVYQMSVNSDSTVTLVTTAGGFATSFRESIMLASQARVASFDVTLLPVAMVTQMNGLGVPAQATTRGLMAVRLHSNNPACVTAGAHLSVWPPLAATVVYSRPDGSGAVDQPDPSMDGVQAGAHVDVWLTGTIPPANMLTIKVDQPGCTLLSQSPSVDGLIFTGLRRVDAQSLTEADLFLD
jgi:hypothetical protein